MAKDSSKALSMASLGMASRAFRRPVTGIFHAPPRISLSAARPPRLQRLQHVGRRFNTSGATGTKPEQPATSLSGKLKELSRKYGRAAIVVYLGISLVDYAVAFGLVHALGTDRIGALEDKAFAVVRDWTGWAPKSSVTDVQDDEPGVVTEAVHKEVQKHGVKPASIWTEAAIAYGIHKAIFIFVRVPITIAITPGIVKALVKRGWKVGPARVAAEAAKKL